ncbi:hypothetical protein [Vibrio alginolyticus]|uniref:hypothetical protein n=1 Tax=Vibrio alginolyticus TaxID=663 RepID=UPI001BD619A7|nr:hypothetical protein [Vibrio alginolyticus]MBT0090786.1 hypothetical protein [Vibrio alginolyticus]
MSNFEHNYNKHVRRARRAAKGLTGLDRAKAIYRYFDSETCHPHAFTTYNQMMLNRVSDHQFAIELMRSMADLVATNEMLAEEAPFNYGKVGQD